MQRKDIPAPARTIEKDLRHFPMTKPMFRTLWIVSFGLFFGSMLGRMTGGHWVSSLAAVGMLIGIFGVLAREGKVAGDEKAPNETKPRNNHGP